MNLLYICNEGIIISKVDDQKIIAIYNKSKDDIDFNEISKIISKFKSIFVVINHDLEFSEHKSFNSKAKKETIANFINAKIDDEKTIVGNSVLIEGLASNSIDQIIHILPNVSTTKYINTIMILLLNSKINIKGIYSYCHLFNLFDDNHDDKFINIKIFSDPSDSYISVYDGYKFIFGTRVRQRSGENYELSVLRNLVIIIKYINTTLSFISKPIQINHFTNNIGKILDISIHKEANNILSNVTISNKTFNNSYETIGFELERNKDAISKIVTFLKNKKLTKIMNKIQNKNFVSKNKMFFLGLYLQITSLITMIIFITYIIYTWVTMSSFRNEIIKKKHSIGIFNIRKNTNLKALKTIESNKYITIVEELSNQIEKEKDSSNFLKKISDTISTFQDIMLVESFIYDCKNCDSAENREQEIKMEIAMFNKNASNELIMNTINNIVNFIKIQLTKDCKFLYIKSPTAPKYFNIRSIALDYRGEIIIACLKEAPQNLIIEEENHKSTNSEQNINPNPNPNPNDL